MSQILLLLMKQIFSPPEQNTVQQLFLRNNLEEKARETLVHYIFDVDHPSKRVSSWFLLISKNQARVVLQPCTKSHILPIAQMHPKFD